MADLSNIIAITVTVQDAAPASDNFGTIAIFSNDGPGSAGAWQGTYNANPAGLAAMVSDGFAVTGNAYALASALCAQNPRTNKFKVYKRATPITQSLELTITKTTPGFKQKLDIGVGGTFASVSYTNGGSETTTTIATALELLIEAVTGVNASAAAAVITVTPAAPTDTVYVKNISRQITFKDVSTDPGIATDLAAALVEDADWYGFVTDGHGAAELNSARVWADANKRHFPATSSDSDIVTSSTTDVGSDFKNANSVYGHVWFSRDLYSGLGCAIMSREFSQQPGTSSWHMKTVTGPTVDSLTETELGFARGKNVNTFVNIKGISATLDGKAGGGRFIDITQGIDWLVARMSERLVGLMARLEKIPFTNEGLGLVESEIRAQLADAETKRILAPGWSVVIPKLETISTNDKANRLLQDVQFFGTLAGAVHKIVIAGTVKV